MQHFCWLLPTSVKLLLDFLIWVYLIVWCAFLLSLPASSTITQARFRAGSWSAWSWRTWRTLTGNTTSHAASGSAAPRATGSLAATCAAQETRTPWWSVSHSYATAERSLCESPAATTGHTPSSKQQRREIKLLPISRNKQQIWSIIILKNCCCQEHSFLLQKKAIFYNSFILKCCSSWKKGRISLEAFLANAMERRYAHFPTVTWSWSGEIRRAFLHCQSALCYCSEQVQGWAWRQARSAGPAPMLTCSSHCSARTETRARRSWQALKTTSSAASQYWGQMTFTSMFIVDMGPKLCFH